MTSQQPAAIDGQQIGSLDSQQTVGINLQPAHASLYVGDLDDDITEAILYEKFSKIGTIVSIRVCRDMISRRGLGYAYVNFGNVQEAIKAIDELNFETLRGRQMRIMWSQRDPSLRKSGVGNLFIKNLSKTVEVRELYDTFSTIGDILSCKIPLDDKGQSKGYGFVHFASKESADLAIQKTNGSIVSDKKVYVGYFIPKHLRQSQSSSGPLFNNLFVKNFGENMSEDILRKLFQEFGEITSIFVPIKDEKKSKGFGFVCYKQPSDAARAVEQMNNIDYEGQQLFVGRAMKKSERVEHLKVVFNKKRSEKTQSYAIGVNLYVKNLDDTITDELLKAEFIKFGNITSAKVMTDTQGRSKGFGFVCFGYPDDATKAVTEMSGKLLNTKPIYVALAQRKEERKAHLQSLAHQRQMAYRYPHQGSQLQPGVMQPNPQPLHNFGTSNFATHGIQPGHFMMYPSLNLGNQPYAFSQYALPGMNRLMAPSATAIRHRGSTRIGGPQAGGLYAPLTGQPGMQGYPQLQRPNTNFVRPSAQQPLVVPNFTPRPTTASGNPPNLNRTNISYSAGAKNLEASSNQFKIPSNGPEKTVSVQIKNEQGGPDGEFLKKLSMCSPDNEKQFIGEQLYQIISRWAPEGLLGKLTGMLLEIESRELVTMILDEMHNSQSGTPSHLKTKFDAAYQVLLSGQK